MSELSEDELQRLLTLDHSDPLIATVTRQPEPEAAPVSSFVTSMPTEPPPAVPNLILPDVTVQIAIDSTCQISLQLKRFNATKIWPLAPGKIVRLNGVGCDQSKWSLKVQLVECRHEANVWHLQATLLHAPKLTDLLQALQPSR